MPGFGAFLPYRHPICNIGRSQFAVKKSRILVYDDYNLVLLQQCHQQCLIHTAKGAQLYTYTYIYMLKFNVSINASGKDRSFS